VISRIRSSWWARYSCRLTRRIHAPAAPAVPAATARPSDETISPVYSGCRIQRYGPSSTTSRAWAITERFLPKLRSDQTDHAVPATRSTSVATCRPVPERSPVSNGNANGSRVATTAATCAVRDVVVALAGPRRTYAQMISA